MPTPEFWESRYGDTSYAYGTEPNLFFRQQLEKLEPGRLLLPAEGEGRNAVFAAEMGWEVDAFDHSSAGRRKALALADRKKVSIHYRLSSVSDFPFPVSAYDAAGLIFAHLPAKERTELHRRSFEALRPGGLIVLESFSVEQLGNSSGGPKTTEMLLRESDIHHDFSEAKILFLAAEKITLDEGPFHQGEAAVIRFVGQKTSS
jgi:hypothetical protein